VRRDGVARRSSGRGDHGHAANPGADAIVVGHGDRSEDREQVLGSVPKSVLEELTVPVTVAA